jgi:LacI family transcriptional regulator
MVSIKDIAKTVGVSTSTVSFVLNGKDKEMRISEVLSKKIKKVAKDAGYQRNQVAVSLRTGKSKIIALIVDTISGSFFASLARIIEQEANIYGYRIIYCSTGNDVANSAEFFSMLYQYQIDGYLVIPSKGIEKELRQLVVKNKPLVFIDTFFTNMNTPYVLVDNYDGVAKGMNYLAQKGYRRLAFVCNNVEMVQMQERIRGYKETLKKHKIKNGPKLICVTNIGDPKEKVVKEIATFIEKEKPDAIMFAANYLGVCGLESIMSLGLKIPDDIAVVCFDDLDLFNLYPPGITSIRQPIEEIAKTAIHLLMSEMGYKVKVDKKQVLLAPQIIERHSA